MALEYDSALALQETGLRSSYGVKDTMLYALSIGMGRDPYDPKELPFVFEGGGLRVVPTMATTLSGRSLVSRMDIDLPKMLHGEQRMKVHRPIPAAADLTTDMRVVDVLDKGEGKGAIIYTENVLREAGNPDPLVTLGYSLFARGDGGFGGPQRPAIPIHELPDRAPDLRHESDTRLDQALLYRLNGDMNPLHADPELAKKVGFKVPILHGLCGYAVACRAVLATVCDYEPDRIAEFDVRFSSPVYPGEKITTEIWVDGNTVSFRCRVEERDIVSINSGKCVLRDA